MLTGVILAGGRNRRMEGRIKALLPFGDRPILQRQLEEMAKLCPQILVVANVPEALEHVVSAHQRAQVRIIPDLFPGAGPLGGLHAALLEAEGEQVWTVGCDMPSISAEAAKWMVAVSGDNSRDAVIPVIHGKIHPLHAIYRKRIATVAESLLQQKKHSLMGLLEQIRWLQANEEDFSAQGIDPGFVTNLNTPEEYRRAARLNLP